MGQDKGAGLGGRRKGKGQGKAVQVHSASSLAASSLLLPIMAALVPPDAYGIVEPGVHRANVLQPSNFAFVATLQLRKALILSPETPTKAVAAFLDENRIELVRALVEEGWWDEGRGGEGRRGEGELGGAGPERAVGKGRGRSHPCSSTARFRALFDQPDSVLFAARSSLFNSPILVLHLCEVLIGPARTRALSLSLSLRSRLNADPLGDACRPRNELVEARQRRARQGRPPARAGPGQPPGADHVHVRSRPVESREPRREPASAHIVARRRPFPCLRPIAPSLMPRPYPCPLPPLVPSLMPLPSPPPHIRSGIHQTGTFVGCLRKLQGWNLNSIIVEVPYQGAGLGPPAARRAPLTWFGRAGRSGSTARTQAARRGT